MVCFVTYIGIRFLAAGEPPTYIGWGSVVCGSASDMARLAVGALKLAGKRGVVLGGWAKVGATDLGDAALEAYAAANVLFLTTAPHVYLFARCAVVCCFGVDTS